MFVLIQATKAVLEVRPILSPMANGIRITFGDAYIGEEAVPVPKSCLSRRDKDDDSYDHFGTIAFINLDRDDPTVKVPLMQ
jgi:hypothetical protein